MLQLVLQEVEALGVRMLIKVAVNCYTIALVDYSFCNKLGLDFIDLSFAAIDMQQNKRHETMRVI